MAASRSFKFRIVPESPHGPLHSFTISRTGAGNLPFEIGQGALEIGLIFSRKTFSHGNEDSFQSG